MFVLSKKVFMLLNLANDQINPRSENLSPLTCPFGLVGGESLAGVGSSCTADT